MYKKKKHLIYHLIALILLIFIKDCESLKSLTIHVPEMAKSGDTVTLVCEYDLEQVALYTIKWYRNEVEFYRYVPKESPPSKAFSMPHVNVDISRSDPKKVTLRAIRKELTGIYKCEVSADAPLFHTDMKSAHMTVADIPESDPLLEIDPPKVQIGKRVVADCYTSGSDPPANITWYINCEKVTVGDEDVHLHATQYQTDVALGLRSSHSRIELIANRSLFVMGHLAIACEANVYKLWNRTIERQVDEESSVLLGPALGSTSLQDPLNAFDVIVNSTTIRETSINLILFTLFIYVIVITIKQELRLEEKL